jgi:hypothetical protein
MGRRGAGGKRGHSSGLSGGSGEKIYPRGTEKTEIGNRVTQADGCFIFKFFGIPRCTLSLCGEFFPCCLR